VLKSIIDTLAVISTTLFPSKSQQLQLLHGCITLLACHLNNNTVTYGHRQSPHSEDVCSPVTYIQESRCSMKIFLFIFLFLRWMCGGVAHSWKNHK